jgi:hypothetical protein
MVPVVANTRLQLPLFRQRRPGAALTARVLSMRDVGKFTTGMLAWCWIFREINDYPSHQRYLPLVLKE